MKRRSADLLFVHGIGMWPKLFRPVQRIVCAAATDEQIWVRPGYDEADGPQPFAAQVDALEATIVHHKPVLVVGLGEGATLALACALRQPEGLEGIVTHEPSIGPLEPDLHRSAREHAARLDADRSPAAATDYLARLYDPGWTRLPAAARRWAKEHHLVVRREPSEFASFEPSLSDLEGIEVPHLTTVGEHSAPARHRVAKLLEETGAERTEIENGTHLVVRSQPLRFANTITTWAELAPTQAAML